MAKRLRTLLCAVSFLMVFTSCGFSKDDEDSVNSVVSIDLFGKKLNVRAVDQDLEQNCYFFDTYWVTADNPTCNLAESGSLMNESKIYSVTSEDGKINYSITPTSPIEGERFAQWDIDGEKYYCRAHEFGPIYNEDGSVGFSDTRFMFLTTSDAETIASLDTSAVLSVNFSSGVSIDACKVFTGEK